MGVLGLIGTLIRPLPLNLLLTAIAPPCAITGGGPSTPRGHGLALGPSAHRRLPAPRGGPDRWVGGWKRMGGNSGSERMGEAAAMPPPQPPSIQHRPHTSLDVPPSLQCPSRPLTKGRDSPRLFTPRARC